FPSRYDVEARRQHRWMRGDWQLLPWIFARGYDLVGDRKRARIPMLARWKMLDNLRRSLSAPALLLAFLWGWTLPAPADVNWTLFVLAAIVVPPLLPLVTAIIPHRVGISRRTHIRNLARDFTLAFTQILFVFTFLRVPPGFRSMPSCAPCSVFSSAATCSNGCRSRAAITTGDPISKAWHCSLPEASHSRASPRPSFWQRNLPT